MLEIVSFVILTVLNVLLGLIVIAKNPKSITHRFYLALTISFGAYSTVNEISLHPFGLSQLSWIRLDLFCGAYLFYLAYMTFYVFPAPSIKHWGRVPIIATIFTVFVSFFVLTPFVFSHMEIQNGSAQPVPAPGIALFAIQQIGTLILAVSTLLRKQRAAKGVEKLQYRYIVTGLALTLASITFFNFILVQVFKNSSLVFLGSSSTIFFSAAFAYAIIRHQLLDIRAVVARSVAYFLLLASIAVLYGIAVFSASELLFPDSGSSIYQNLFYVALAVVLAFTFQPLKSFFEHLTDNIFFRDRYDSQKVLSDLGQILVAEFKLDRLLRKSLIKICAELKIGNAQFYVFDEGRIYKVEHYGAVPHKMITARHLQSLHHRTLVTDELDEGHEKELMEEFGYRVVLHLRTKEEFVGYLLLGDKLSGDIYTNQDIEVLEILTQELAVAISNAKAYEEIATFNATLQDKVDDATKRLRSANVHLKELDEAKDEFISMASHQLRTPLTTIKGYLSMLQEGDAGKMKPEQLEFINYAYAGSQRMVNLISDLLNVSRMSAGKFLIEKAPIDLSVVTAEEVQQLQNHAVAKNLKLSYVAPKQKLPPIELDENKTRQVIMNFIDNAVYYTKEGSVTVTLDKVGGNLELRVKDTGIGVPPDAQKKLFTKFYRAGNAQTVRPDGTGLGLFLAKRVIEDQGGTIIFETEEGKGSTFGFALPISVKKVKSDDANKQSPRQPAAVGIKDGK